MTTWWLTYGGWFAAGVLAIVAAWLWVDLVEARRAATRQQIRAEEADAWADEHQREAAVLAGDLDGLRERHATLTEVYGEAVRRLLAVNYIVIHRNLDWKRRRQDQ